MTIKPRTIDNLGVEASIRYATDKERLDARLIEDSKWVPRQIEVSVVKPYIPSEFDKLFGAKPSLQWALFSAPPAFEAQPRALFSYQVAPSLGSTEKLETDLEKLEALESTIEKEESQDRQQKEKERKRLVALLKCLGKLDKNLSFINSRRNQYQRG